MPRKRSQQPHRPGSDVGRPTPNQSSAGDHPEGTGQQGPPPVRIPLGPNSVLIIPSSAPWTSAKEFEEQIGRAFERLYGKWTRVVGLLHRPSPNQPPSEFFKASKELERRVKAALKQAVVEEDTPEGLAKRPPTHDELVRARELLGLPPRSVRTHGRPGGRPRKPAIEKLAAALKQRPGADSRVLAKQYGVHRSTVYRLRKELRSRH